MKLLLEMEKVDGDQYFCKGQRLSFDLPWSVYVVNRDLYTPYYRVYIGRRLMCIRQSLDKSYEYLRNVSKEEAHIAEIGDSSQVNNQTLESSGKVKNVIKGYLSKYDIEEITFFEGDECMFSGPYENFNKVHYDTDKYLWEVKEKILNSDCIKCILHNSSKLFIFY